MIPNIVTYEEMDRMLFEPMRLAAVAAGYLPDVTTFNDGSAYAAAKQAIRDSGKQIIEIFGPGTYTERDGKSSARILIDRVNSYPGHIGLSGMTYHEEYEDANGHTRFRVIQAPDSTRRVKYQVRVLADTAKYFRIACALIDATLHSRRAMHTVDETGAFTDKWVLLELGNVYDLSDRDFLEHVYQYNCQDVFVEPSAELRGDIVQLTTANIGIYSKELPPVLLDHIDIISDNDLIAVDVGGGRLIADPSGGNLIAY